VTIVIAMRCTDGVVIGADSALSYDIGTRQPVEKIKRLGEHPILYGAAGDVDLHQKLDQNLQSVKMRPSLQVMRREIKKYIGPELRESAQQHAPYPLPRYHQPPQAILLFVGILDGEPWVLQIEKDNTDTLFGDDLGNFAAIGSGELLARALFRPHLETQRDLELGKIFAYRILDDVIELSSEGVAHPIHVHTISLTGTVGRVESAEMRQLNSLCEGWREVEREALEEVLTGPTNERVADIPAPTDEA
jgi:proteasome beta subunit